MPSKRKQSLVEAIAEATASAPKASAFKARTEQPTREQIATIAMAEHRKRERIAEIAREEQAENAIRTAYINGFLASSEGWNGEIATDDPSKISKVEAQADAYLERYKGLSKP